MVQGGDEIGDVEVADVRRLTGAQRRLLVDRALATKDQDTERFLLRLKERMDRCDCSTSTGLGFRGKIRSAS